MQNCLGGGFPDLFMIELCAQISGLALVENEQEQTAYLGAIRDFTFSRHVYAGDLLTVEAVIEGTFGSFVSAACRVTCAGLECAAGRLTLSF